jgi:hypothetical protein
MKGSKIERKKKLRGDAATVCESSSGLSALLNGMNLTHTCAPNTIMRGIELPSKSTVWRPAIPLWWRLIRGQNLGVPQFRSFEPHWQKNKRRLTTTWTRYLVSLTYIDTILKAWSLEYCFALGKFADDRQALLQRRDDSTQGWSGQQLCNRRAIINIVLN